MTVAPTIPTTAQLDERAIEWLLASDEPGIRLQARRDLLGERVDANREEILRGPKTRALLDGQQADGGFGVHPYGKWTGAHWRLVSLVELGSPVVEPRALAAFETVLGWLFGAGHRRVPHIAGRYRRCASQEGNALAVGVRLGLAGDDRVQALAHSLIGWQWPDGGWNCDRERRVTHSSFHESLPPVWGLTEYGRETDDADALAGAKRGAEFFLAHSLYRSHRTGEVGDTRWLQLHYPHYWHYDLLYGLVILTRAGVLPDSRAADALQVLRSKQGSDGKWSPEGTAYWRGSGDMYREAAAWERRGPSQMLTLNALRVLHSGS